MGMNSINNDTQIIRGRKMRKLIRPLESYSIGGRTFHEIPTDNGSREFIATDGGEISRVEWAAYSEIIRAKHSNEREVTGFIWGDGVILGVARP